MKKIILVAGATGDLGGRIIKNLVKRGAEVRAIVRKGSDKKKTDLLKEQGVTIIPVDMTNENELAEACKNVTCVISALAGLHEVIVETQTILLNAAVKAGVSRFIPSDFCTDYTQIKEGENRNFDLRREFMKTIDKSGIAATSIFNGAFGEILMYGTPFLDFKKKNVGYWGDENWKVDFTTMDDTAAYTAETALDENTPRILRIASFQVSAKDMVALAKDVLKEDYSLTRIAGTEELSAQNKIARSAQPEGEKEIYPQWQRGQYMHSMFTAKHPSLDNERYPDLKWTSFKELMATRR